MVCFKLVLELRLRCVVGRSLNSVATSRGYSVSVFLRILLHLRWVRLGSFGYTNQCASKFASSSSDKRVKIWDWRSRECVHTFEGAHGDQVSLADFGLEMNPVVFANRCGH